MNAIVASETRALSEVLARLGGVPIERIRLRWPLGEVTEEEWIEANKSGRFELVDGVLVEKAMGWFETRLGFILGMIVEMFVAEHDLGFVVVETGATRIEGQTRMPDVAFFPWTRFPDRRLARTAALGVAPDLAVEV